MPLQNRVTPWGALEAVTVRYPTGTAAFGNRGTLHNSHREIVRSWQSKAWLACKLEVSRTRNVQREDNRAFNGRKRIVMKAGHYTELFFLDQFVATAAGHRPCACCRHSEYRAFLNAWTRANPRVEPWTAGAIDERLHAERFVATGQSIGGSVWQEPLSELPEGAFVSLASEEETVASRRAWLNWRGHLLRWSHTGYCAAMPHGDVKCRVVLLTPPSLVATMRAGFVPGPVDESASALLLAGRALKRKVCDECEEIGV